MTTPIFKSKNFQTSFCQGPALAQGRPLPGIVAKKAHERRIVFEKTESAAVCDPTHCRDLLVKHTWKVTLLKIKCFSKPAL